MLFGNYHWPYITRVPRARINERIAALERVFEAQDGATLLAALEPIRPTYLWVDEREPSPTRAISQLVQQGLVRVSFDKRPILVLQVMLADERGRIYKSIAPAQGKNPPGSVAPFPRSNIRPLDDDASTLRLDQLGSP